MNFYIPDKKEHFLDQKKSVLKHCKIWKFSKGISPRFLSINRTFYHVCLLRKSIQKDVFLSSGEKKRVLFRLEKLSFKNVQKSGFSKGISPLFLSKNKSFYDLCFLG